MKKVLIAGGVAVAAMAFVAFALFQLCFQKTSPDRLADHPSAAPLPAASADRDGDGVPDGEDIVQGVLDYIQGRPRYGGRYYAGGYPDDGYGVCSDLVAYGLREGGYDLRELVNGDILARSGAYGMTADEADKDIDYRRVRNLTVFFEDNADALTLDVGGGGEWLPGDIVIFDEHIGIVSDRRNERGIPYVFHHESPFQATYEDDILGRRGDLTGHYRMRG